jgi:hypothetical protein
LNTKLPREQMDAHPGCISWEQYDDNLLRLRECSGGRRKRPPREGPALLKGLVSLWDLWAPNQSAILSRSAVPD